MPKKTALTNKWNVERGLKLVEEPLVVLGEEADVG